MDFSGLGNNKTFKAGGDPADPYLYLSGTLDLSGAVDGGTYYFNLDNNFDYASNPDYGRFIIVDHTSIISEVIVYSNDDLVAVDPNNLPTLRIGGANRQDVVEPYVKVPWGGPSGLLPVAPPSFSWDDLELADVNEGAVNYFGHEGGHFPYFEDLDSNPDPSNSYRYLAVTVNWENAAAASRSLSEEAKQRKKRLMVRPRSLPVGEKVIQSGNLSVVLKLYPQNA